MKIIYTADLHNGLTSYNTLIEFAESANEIEPDVVILGGDLGENIKSSFLATECIKLFKAKNPTLVIPGNHDLWILPGIHREDSYSVFNQLMPQSVRDVSAFWLETENYIIDDVAFVGSYLHYDYSAKDETGVIPNFPDKFFAKHKGVVNNDANFLIGLPADKKFAKELGNAFLERLKKAEDDSRINKIIIATHCTCYPNHVIRKPYDYNWSLGTPFYYNLSVWPSIFKCKKVVRVFSGHSHFEKYDDVVFENGHVVGVSVVGSNIGNPKYELFEI